MYTDTDALVAEQLAKVAAEATLMKLAAKRQRKSREWVVPAAAGLAGAGIGGMLFARPIAESARYALGRWLAGAVTPDMLERAMLMPAGTEAARRLPTRVKFLRWLAGGGEKGGERIVRFLATGEKSRGLTSIPARTLPYVTKGRPVREWLARSKWLAAPAVAGLGAAGLGYLYQTESPYFAPAAGGLAAAATLGTLLSRMRYGQKLVSGEAVRLGDILLRAFPGAGAAPFLSKALVYGGIPAAVGLGAWALARRLQGD